MRMLSCIDLLNRWRQQIGRRPIRGPRGIGALGYMVDADAETNNLVNVKRLHFVVVYDDAIARNRTVLRLASYRVSKIDHGIQFGGLANARLYKDMHLRPRPGGGRMRVDLLSTTALQLALGLNERINAALHYCPRAARRGLRLPRLWAAFPANAEPSGSGPELDSLCERFGARPEFMMRKFRREQDGLALYPMAWVSEQLKDAAGVFAELTGFPRRQVFGVSNPEVDLVGFEGAAAFDFYASHARPQKPPAGYLASAG